MFSNLRNNSIVYILEKGENPSLRMGQVESISQPRPKFGTPVYAQFNDDKVLDVKVKVGEEPMDFQNLPFTQSIASYGNTVISDTKEAMNAEVEAMCQTSRQIIDSVPYHQSVLSACEDILRTLNPQLAKEAKEKERIDNMERKLDQLISLFESQNK